MFEGLNHINIAGTEYPIKCDLYVLECIQDKYGAIEKFEKGIRFREEVDGMVPKKNADGTPALDENGKEIMIPGKVWEYKDPDMKMLNHGLELMINEGIDIQNEDHAESEPGEPEPIDFAWLLYMGMQFGLQKKEVKQLYLGQWVDLFRVHKENHNFEAKRGLYKLPPVRVSLLDI